MVIILMGYMGSGKSTIGKHLASILDYKFIDLDSFIEDNEAQKISKIFETKGEIYFRKKETFYLEQLLQTTATTVLSLGGGTPCYGNNMKLILEANNAKSFYLKASIPILSKRLIKEKEQRPVISHLKSEEDIIEFIGKHLFERNTYYLQSNYTVNTDHLSIQQVAENIVAKLV